ncbi:mediator of RNA polymerase II transcription subunit 26 [Drosophila rhopaloa]|uniref:Mediator of RNA polymerase II transcription subunit 26 n=1 Tax=Drosophila rhopaloa TaxID=1041015 RepID=A0A6P4FET6_DRORH|nr:mediator of RNA polymerase II transcription subunit 26 [Drosophila rhopaloa]XP_016984042.1 mediator of RNA polymerase II transcription subunit 26 [Drosophila rhopaloa]
MNQNQIQQLTTHLSQALDQNYDVVNMEAVLSVICALEGTTITKEQLEATRLAKYINQLRRRTKNESLARRAKSLLKKWREMVGIQQSATENMQHPSQIPSLPTQLSSNFVKSDAAAPDSHLSESVEHFPFSQSLPSKQIISDEQSNADLSEPPPLSVHTQAHTNFLNLVNNCERDENNSLTTVHSRKERRQSQPILNRHKGSPQPSLNSVLNLNNVSTEKINEASVVIDIVSDSDENDNHYAPKREKSNLNVPVPLVVPTTPSSRQKKLKKEKKSKDRDGQIGQNLRFGAKGSDGLLQSTLAPDSEIFSLSNSSISSILSGDATLGNSQHKTRLSSSELTFTGRFKSVNQLDVLSQSNSGFLAGHNSVFQSNESGKQKFDDYNAYDSSASCSRLSPSTVEEVRKPENVIDARLHNVTATQMPMPTAGIGYDPNSRPEYLENFCQSQIPKRRGRKKGSKGVDAVIAKESSSLSQQIFFGGSTVKKVKTTKELFNEIQSRKLSVSMQSSTSNLSNSSTNRELATRTTFPRPTSSCSDTSMHSPQILETYSGNATFKSKVEDPANTDSDTVTSEPSHDSNKSQEIKECTSVESNSNSIQTLPLERNLKNLMPKNLHDITTQLMHLINSLNSPLSEFEIEKLYQAQIVPCTCIVIEEVQSTVGELISTSDIDTNDPKTILNHKENISRHKNEEKLFSVERSDNEEVGATQPKPVKSIFDLDFDDNDDPLHSIMDEIQKPIIKVEEIIKKSSDTKNVSVILSTNNDSLNLINFNADAQLDNSNQEIESSVVLPVFTVHEDPDCVAKQRFYVQTNKVNNFHINALHNFYIPNINGNWDSVDSSSSFQSETNVDHILKSYTVTNGADVVPKYGLLTSDRIRKDLSSLKFIKPFKAKPYRCYMTPFLGVAKCLPTCRRARHRFKEWVKSSSTPDAISKSVEGPENNIEHKSSSPLKVNIDVPITGMNSHNENYVPMKVYSNIKKSPLSNSIFDSCSENDFSYNLLKLANGEAQFGDAEVSDKSSDHESQDNSPYSDSISSTCSYYSLKETQDSINKKLRNHRTQSTVTKLETTRKNKKINAMDFTINKKRERNEFNGPVKRIRIALNGTFSNPSSNNNSSDSDNEAENEFENGNNEEYAVVQRSIGDGEACSNHIVLTIKKTPSKINSPANSMTAVSPNTNSDMVNVKKTIPNSNQEHTTISQNTNEISLKKDNLISKTSKLSPRRRHYRYRRTCRKHHKRQSKTIDLELKHLFHCKPKSTDSSSDTKLHHKLFFPQELCRENSAGRKERVLNYSSSSSSSFDDDSEVENTSSKGEEEAKTLSTFDICNLNIKTETSAAASVSEVQFESDEDSCLTLLSDGDLDEQEVIQEVSDTVKLVDELNDFRNNSMLQSFNSLYADRLLTKPKAVPEVSMETSPPLASLELLRNENSDVSNSNNNHLGVDLSNEFSNKRRYSIDSAESTIKLPLIGVEYRTGIRSSSDAAPTRIQQFQEWHQVLQLKSYNNEPLIVLPYVLLE